MKAARPSTDALSPIPKFAENKKEYVKYRDKCRLLEKRVSLLTSRNLQMEAALRDANLAVPPDNTQHAAGMMAVTKVVIVLLEKCLQK